ncbi:VOC family protein [Martelella mediterranea]|uniref:Biphenyl-2,3-diol 1,2-dioxygenase n=1 Tax=Martelella mediterranea DSM 17316 TaxID=1122214 RepID=A0A1U9Z8D8_9HYPH|nr:VOC family protein [Martelella mediterranea]AQZ53944.1 Biphenyl-2,3-diol 1,2-dioxygenase [Martelella mediterranea DSM 17316]MCD1634721.1 VOC family protein [Martelella mediterranea]
MSIISLGYMGINSKRLGDWEGFATDLLGMQKVDQGGPMRMFRMDDRKQRLIVTGEGEEDLAFMGWEVGSPEDLEALAARLENAGFPVTLHGASLSDQRHVARLISFHDPDGNRLEAFYGPEIASDPFLSGRPISGFKTGSLGMGHAVLHVANVEGILHFYRDILGFNVTDYGLKPYPLYFFHVNGRHHSFAMVGSGRKGIHHFMVELLSLDDVGQGYDIAQQRDEGIAYTLGRHSNDHMMSFYTNTPSKFFVEYGWGAQVVDPETWKPFETHEGPSTWGHERVYLPEDDEVRIRMREMRHKNARDGFRAPDPKPNCAWLDSVVHAE